MTTRVLQTAFTSGEIAPQLIGRTDDSGYRSGAYKLENFIVLPQGSIRSRSGFQYVSTAKDSNTVIRLIPFRFASDQTLVLVFGEKTMRIVTQGMEVLNSDGSVYEISTPFSAYDLQGLDYSQNADVITFTSHYTAPYELVRYGATDWRWRQVTVSPTISPPSTVNVTAQFASYLTESEEKDKYKLTVRYVVTAFDNNGYESVASAAKTGTGNFYINGCSIRISWNAVSGAERYRVYRYVAGIYGYIGETSETYLDDTGDNPDTSTTPPRYKDVFAGSSSGIQSISVTASGSGYYYSTNNGTYYVPTFIQLNSIPLIVFEPAYSITISADNKSLNWFDNVTINNVYLDVYSNGSVVQSIPIGYEVYTYNNDRVKAVFLKNSGTAQTFSLAYDNLINPLFKVRVDYKWASHSDSSTNNIYVNQTTHTEKYSGTGSDWNTISGTETLYDFSSNVSGKTLGDADFYNTGFSFEQLASAYGYVSNASLQIPLTITSSTGKDASAYAVASNGRIVNAYVTKRGSGYKDAVVTANTSVGSGATFSVVLSNASLPDLPSTVTQYDQRRVFAGSEKNPLRVWFTNAGYQDLMMYHVPTMSDDRIVVDAVTSDADRIRHAVALESLLLFTGSSELRVYTQNSDALSPSSVAVRAQSYIGANECQPVILNNQVIFAASRGGHIYCMGYQNSAASYVSAYISHRAQNLFYSTNNFSLSLSKAPVQMVWAITANGKLLGCTLYPDQNVIAWHEHVTNGTFESLCVVPEGTEDVLYVAVKRNGTRYIERMEYTTVSNDSTSWRYLDCYSEGTFSTATSAVTGLSYLEGQTVAVFADGKPQSNKVVRNGKITLDTPAKNVAVGLPYTCTLETLPLIAQAEANLQGRVKNIAELFLRVIYDGDLYANNLYAEKLYKVKKDDVYMKPHGTKGYVVKVSTDGNWDYDAQLRVEHRDCQPIEIAAITANISTEGGK